jgi:FKBP-type peptidyl-prolyl cis-trans isomerase
MLHSHLRPNNPLKVLTLFFFCMKYSLLFSFLIIARLMLAAQPVIDLPGNTGYAIPAGNEGAKTDIVFDEKKGAINWINPKQSLHYFFYVKEPGAVQVTITMMNDRPAGSLKLICNQQQHIIPASRPGTRITVKAGSLSFTKPGFYELTLLPFNKPVYQLPGIESIHFKGNIASSIHANQKPRRNAASVHLKYPFSDTLKAVGFYNELTIPKGADHLFSYYMACGFSRGYFGMQVNSTTERRIIFSVWDSGKEPDDRNKVKEADKVQLTGKGEAVIAEDFGNEGTGGHSHWLYNWKTGTTYRFYVTALPDSNDTYYSGYFFIPELRQWKLIASFKAPNDGKYLKNLYSFVENFDGSNGQLHRKALFGNQWIQTEDRQWKELNEAKFTYDATGRAGDRIDYDAGIESGKFSLSNGGFIKGTAKIDSTYSRPLAKQSPVAGLYKNADSAIETAREKQAIFEAIASGKLDTTGSKDGVYYKILAEGNGRHVMVSDTVVAFYKGSILNGGIFDQTEKDPATFPLSRLIRGWQTGVPMCKTGGKIRLIIPSALAYSIRTRSPKIPPNSILVFDIEVVGVK